MMTRSNRTRCALLMGVLATSATAGEKEELLKLKNTTVNLIDLLVEQGVLSKKKARDLIKAAETKAAQEAKQQIADDEAAASEQSATAPEGAENVPKGEKGKSSKSIHVGYVPEFVKDEIRKEVRAELKEDVLKDVKEHAKTEKWGIPDALPDWISRIKLSGDLRLRVADDLFQKDNAQYFDWLQINKDGGLISALNKNNAYLNTTTDRLRLRERFRIGIDADIGDGLKAGFRFATSNNFNPVSNNQTLGNAGQSFQFAIDRAFLQYDYVDSKGNDWLSLYGGRIINPFVSTDVVYDPDLSFEGFAGTFRLRFNQDDVGVKSYHAPNATGRIGINMGPQTPDSIFLTAGIFPIQEVNLSSKDKWLYGGQLGADWLAGDDSRLKFAASYYKYENIRAKRNKLNSFEYDWTAPQFMQKGNSLVAINDSTNQESCRPSSNSTTPTALNTCLVGLASDFEIFNVTAMYDFARFAPTHIMLTADYAKNLGFDQGRIRREFGDNKAPKTNAYQVRLDVGRTEIRRFGEWGAFFAYRYIERDAVLDAFTDSVFHQGGTDAKGWVLGAAYGLAKNTWLNFRWFSTDSIDEAPLSIDTITLDLWARF